MDEYFWFCRSVLWVLLFSLVLELSNQVDKSCLLTANRASNSSCPLYQCWIFFIFKVKLLPKIPVNTWTRSEEQQPAATDASSSLNQPRWFITLFHMELDFFFFLSPSLGFSLHASKQEVFNPLTIHRLWVGKYVPTWLTCRETWREGRKNPLQQILLQVI